MAAHARRRLRLMLAAAVSLLAAVAIVNLAVNPYGAWPLAIVDGIFLRITTGTERVATPYRLRAERPHTVIVGTSRMLEGMRIDQGAHDGVLNAGLGGATLDEIARELQLALESPALQRVVWGVDFAAFGTQLIGFRDRQTQRRLEKDPVIRLREALFSFETLVLSGRVLLRWLGGEARLPWMRRAPVPWPEETIQASLAALPRNDLVARKGELDEYLKSWLDFYQRYEWSDRQLHLYREVVAQLHARGIEVILLLPPLSVHELEVIRRAGRWGVFQRWKRELAGVSPYWDFSGYNAIAMRDDLFTELVINHFHPAVGHTILRALLGQPCAGCGTMARAIIDAGQWIDATTVEAHLLRQDLDLQRYAARQSIQSAAVEASFRREF